MGRERPEVAYFVSDFLPASEIFMIEQARHLARFAPKFIALRRQGSKTALSAATPVDCLSDSRQGRIAAAELRFAGRVNPIFSGLTKNAALLHAQFGKNGYLAWPIARKLGLPLVTTFHGYDATYVGNPLSTEGFNQKLFFWQGRRRMAAAKLPCIAVSNYIRRRLIGLGFDERAVVTRYIGIDVGAFSPRPEIARAPHRVVCISRFVEYKGHRFVIEALAALQRSGMAIELIMVGDGPLRVQVEEAARKVLASVTVLRDQSQGEVVDLLRSAQLYLHGSYQTETGHAEALGLSILEAQAVGTPVVAFDSGGTSEAVVQGKTGYLVPERDVRAMSSMTASLLNGGDQWAAFSRAASEFVRAQFDIVECTRLLEETYADVVAAYGSGTDSGVRAAGAP